MTKPDMTKFHETGWPARTHDLRLLDLSHIESFEELHGRVKLRKQLEAGNKNVLKMMTGPSRQPEKSIQAEVYV